MTESPEDILLPMEQVMPVVLAGAGGLVAVFIALALVRLWGLKMQTRSKPSGGLDLEELARQREAGEVSQADYEAVRSSLAGAAGGGAPRTGAAGRAEPHPGRPIRENGGAGGDARHRSPSDGQA